MICLIVALLSSQVLSQTLNITTNRVIMAPKQTVIAERGQERLSYYPVDHQSIQQLADRNLFADTFSALKMLPGVASRGSFDGGMYIRGGSAYEMVGVLDDIPISHPYFWGGRMSIFNSRIAQKVDFYPGGYEARGGQSLSGILDIYTKDGHFTETSSEIDISMTEANFYREGPIVPDKTAYMVSYRRTYYDFFSPLFASDDSGPVNMPYLQSFQTKITHKLSDTQTLKTALYYFNDGADTPLNFTDDSEGRFEYNGSRYIASIRLGSLLSKKAYNNALLAYHGNEGHYNQTDAYNVNVNWEVDTFILRDDLTLDLSEKNHIEIGGLVYSEAHNTRQMYTEPPNPTTQGSVTQNVNMVIQFPVILGAGYIQNRWIPSEKHTLITGLRWEGAKAKSMGLNHNLQPRLSYFYQWAPNTTINVYSGQFRQVNQSLDRVVSGTTELQSRLPDLEMEMSTHYGGGVEHTIDNTLRLKAEVFYKDYQHLAIDVGTYPETIHANSGVGKAGGIEFMAHKLPGERLDGWITYTLSKTRRKDIDGWYLPHFDVTHMINVYSNFEWKSSSESTTRLITTAKYSTGLPYTPVLSSKKDPDTGTYRHTLGDRHSKRMAVYFRIDVWLEKESGRWSKRIGVYNLLNTVSPIDYFWDDDQSKESFIQDFPRMLIAGATLKF